MKTVLYVVVAFVLAAVVLTQVGAQTIVGWRLIGQSLNLNNTVTCVYEGRLSDGRRITSTIIVPGTLCPTAPGSTF